jgi:hypothetical protein
MDIEPRQIVKKRLGKTLIAFVSLRSLASQRPEMLATNNFFFWSAAYGRHRARRFLCARLEPELRERTASSSYLVFENLEPIVSTSLNETAHCLPDNEERRTRTRIEFFENRRGDLLINFVEFLKLGIGHRHGVTKVITFRGT